MREIPNLNLEMSTNVDTRNSMRWYTTSSSIGPVMDYTSAVAAVKEICRALETSLGVRSAHVSRDLKEARNMCYTYDDGSAVKPPPIVTELNIKEGIKHEEFQRRKRAGEIMMSDYDRCILTVTQYPGIKGNPETSGSTNFRISFDALLQTGVFRMHTYPGWPWPVAVALGKYAFLRQANVIDFYYYRYTVANAVWVYPPALSAGAVYNASLNHVLDSTALITNVVKKANMSSVDVLTAFAELPKTVVSVFSGIKLVVKILRDFKNRKFNLTKAYERREARMTSEHRRRIAKVDARLRGHRLSNAKRAELNEYRNRLFMGQREMLKQSADELASESASLWLNYRYNIMPNVYLAQDVYDAITKFGRQFVTAKGTVRNDLILPIGPFRFNMSTTQRCTLKRRFSAESAQRGASVLSNDIFTTAWELVPLSFVYDWFINFGDVIAARSYNFSWDDQKCSLAEKRSIHDSYIVPEQSDFVEPPTTKVSGFIYKREIINPYNCIGLVWQPSMSLERQLDLVSLAWRPVRSLLQKRN